MSIRTVCISRGLSATIGQQNIFANGDLFDIVDGEKTARTQMQKDIFYYKPIDLTNTQFESVKSKIFDGLNPKRVKLNCFSQSDLDDLAIRGEKSSGIGGVITYSNIECSNKIGPNWIDDWPKVENITSSSIDVKGKLDVDGTFYYVILPSNFPTSTQVKEGKDAGGNVLSNDFKGSHTLIANTEYILTSNNLISNTNYQIHVVADNGYDTQISPITINIKTL